MSTKTLPDIFAYEDYRAYLADWLAFKNRKGSFSMRAFSQKAGFKAHNMVRLVVSSQRNLSPRSIPKFAEAMRLPEDEAAFFEELVYMNQAPSLKQRLRHLQRLLSHPKRQKAISLKKTQLRLFRNWLGPVIYELIQLPGLSADPDQVLALLGEDHKREEVEAALGDLVAAGLVEVSPDGTWVPRTDRLDSGDGIRSDDLGEYHQSALVKAADALLTIPSADRFFQVLTVAVPLAKLEQLRGLCQKFEQEVWSCVDTPGGPNEAVVQVGVHVFPVTRRKHE